MNDKDVWEQAAAAYLEAAAKFRQASNFLVEASERPKSSAYTKAMTCAEEGLDLLIAQQEAEEE